MRCTTLSLLALALGCAPRDDSVLVRHTSDGRQTPPAPEESSTRAANNDVCLVCHLNYEAEPLVVEHARRGIGCVRCHGDSWEHADDEGHETPPDIMFPPEAIDAACQKCHPTHDVAASEVLARWRERGAEKENPATAVCTDCHGRHRLESRTVRWDRTTGKLTLDHPGSRGE